MKLKVIMASFALLASGAANAFIVDGNDNSELLLNVYDPVNNIAYSQDLGVSYADFTSNIGNAAYSLDFGLNAAALSIFPSLSSLIWNITSAQVEGPDFATWGYLTTINPASTPLSNGNIGDATNVTGVYGGVVDNLNIQSGASGNLNYSNNNNARATQIRNLSNQLFGSVSFANSASVANDMSMQWYVAFDAEGNDGPRYDSIGIWSIDLLTNTLSYAAAVTAVPVPAALWLLVSGLIGLGAVSRRRQIAVA